MQMIKLYTELLPSRTEAAGACPEKAIEAADAPKPEAMGEDGALPNESERVAKRTTTMMATQQGE